MASQPDVDGGFVLLYRRLLDHTAFRNQGEAMAFAWLVMRAAWKPVTVRYKDRQVRLKRGQLAMSVRDMAVHLDRPKGWVERFLQRITRDYMVRTDTETGVNVITICNYSNYQPSQDSAGTGSKTPSGQGRDRAGTQNNEGNEVKKENLITNNSECENAVVDDVDFPTDLIELTQELARIAGCSHSSPRRIMAHQEVVKGWLDASIDMKTVAVPTILQAVASSTEPITSLRYFDAAVRTADARLKAKANGANGSPNGRYVSDTGFTYRSTDPKDVMREAEKRADWSTYYRAKADLEGAHAQ